MSCEDALRLLGAMGRMSEQFASGEPSRSQPAYNGIADFTTTRSLSQSATTWRSLNSQALPSVRVSHLTVATPARSVVVLSPRVGRTGCRVGGALTSFLLLVQSSKFVRVTSSA
jgi:hypothetical protein